MRFSLPAAPHTVPRLLAPSAVLRLGLAASAGALLVLDAASAAATREPERPQTAAATAASAESGTTVYGADYFQGMQLNTAYDMISRIPGFAFSEGSQTRGYAGSAGNVLIDGQHPAGKSESLASALGRIPAAQVDRIEIIRGAAPGIDMQGWPVVANIVRRAAPSVAHAATIQGSIVEDGRFIPTLRYELNRRNGPRSLDLALQSGGFVDFSAGDGTRFRFSADGSLAEAAPLESAGGGRTQSAAGTVRLPLGGGLLSANGNLSRNRYKLDETLDRPTGREAQTVRHANVSGELGTSWEVGIARDLSLTAVAIQRLSDQEMRSKSSTPTRQSLFTSDSLSGESITRATFRLQAAEVLTAEWGGEAAFNFLDRRTSFLVDGNPVLLPSAAVRVEERRGELFGQLVWRPTPALTVEGGSRFELSRISQSGDVSSARSFRYLKPRLLVTWRPAEDHQLRFLAVREVGQLNFGDYVSSVEFQFSGVNAGNPQLRPDTAWLVEAAAEHSFWNRGALTVAARHREISHARDRVPIFHIPSCDVVDGRPVVGFPTCDVVFDGPGNIGDGWSRELQVTLALPLDRFGIRRALVRGDTRLRWSRVTDPTTGERRRLSGQYPWHMTASFTHDVPRLRLSWGVDVILPHHFTTYHVAEVRRTEYDAVVMAHVEHRLTPRTSIRFTINNASRYGYHQTRSVYDGNRASGPLLFDEDRDLAMERNFQLRLRHSF